MKTKKVLTPTEIEVQTQEGRIELVCHNGDETTIICVPKSCVNAIIKGLQ